MPAHSPSPRILVAAPVGGATDAVCALLLEWGFTVERAEDGSAALQSIAAAPVDILLVDDALGGLGALEVAQVVKEDPRLPFIPVVLLREPSPGANTPRAPHTDDYVSKPVRPADLEGRVRTMVRIKELQDELAVTHSELDQVNTVMMRVNEQLLGISRTDGLTGCHNRRHIEELLQDAFEHARRYHEPLAVLMVDIDKFKSVNDEYGHAAGDAVLHQFAGILNVQARGVDKVGRYGGEEFIVLLPATNAEGAAIFAERVRGLIEAHTFTFAGGDLLRTASFGVAAVPDRHMLHQDDLVKAADEALYVAKESGRNRVVVNGSPEFLTHKSNAKPMGRRSTDVPNH